MAATATYAVRAKNTAVLSDNKMHDDGVARTYGFAGGLVPGVDVYAYLAHVPTERWGRPWLEHGTLSARFTRPVYDGDDVSIVATDAVDGLTLALATHEPCATAYATMPSGPVAATAVDVDTAPLPADRPPASPEALEPGRVLGSLEFGFHADKAGAYLDDIGETLPLFREEGIAHPGWLLRSANYVLAENVRLGPWIHVSSAVTHFGLAHDGDDLTTRARVTDQFEKKGHRFVVLDVLIVAAGDRPIQRVEHTAIYEPRRR